MTRTATRRYSPQELQASVAEPNWIVRSMSKKDTTFAGNPCRTRFSLLHFYKCYPERLALAVPFAAAFGLLAGVLGHLDWRITLSLTVAVPVLALVNAAQAMMKKFATGNVVPAFVLDDSHVAAFANLTADYGPPKNAIKVILAPVARLAGGPYRAGDRVPCVCLYAGPAQGGAWQGVSPIPVAAGTADPVALARVERSISEADWAKAREAISRHGSTKPGLYRLW